MTFNKRSRCFGGVGGWCGENSAGLGPGQGLAGLHLYFPALASPSRGQQVLTPGQRLPGAEEREPFWAGLGFWEVGTGRNGCLVSSMPTLGFCFPLPHASSSLLSLAGEEAGSRRRAPLDRQDSEAGSDVGRPSLPCPCSSFSTPECSQAGRRPRPPRRLPEQDMPALTVQQPVSAAPAPP